MPRPIRINLTVKAASLVAEADPLFNSKRTKGADLVSARHTAPSEMLLANRFCANQTLTPALRATPLPHGYALPTFRGGV